MSNQEKRCAIGKALGLVIGEPNTHEHDNLGMQRDPKVYAKKKCTLCNGSGVFSVNIPVSTETFKKAPLFLQNSLFHQNKQNRYATKEARVCSCSTTRRAAKKE